MANERVITFFTTAKPFTGHSGIIQRNALQSWKLLHRDVEVILFGDEEGAAEVCREFGLRHEPFVERHESGMKLLGYMFERAQNIAQQDFLCYSNCDIVLMKDFREAFERAVVWQRSFLMVARRWDTDVEEAIDFSQDDWSTKLYRLAVETGHLQSPDFVDFFVFRKGLYDRVPPLVVGRSYWDHWLIAKALDRGASVLDATRVVAPVHQNHGYGYHPGGKLGTNIDLIAMQNLQLAGGLQRLRTIEDAPYQLTRSGITRNRLYWLAPLNRRWQRASRGIRTTLRVHLWHPLLNATRTARHKLGIKHENIVPDFWRRFRNRGHWLD